MRRSTRRRFAGRSKEDMAATSAQIYDWVERYAGIVAEQKQYLTGLDAAIGDGDHGINMDRGFQAVLVKIAPVRDKDAGTLLKTTGIAVVGSGGGRRPALRHLLSAGRRSARWEIGDLRSGSRRRARGGVEGRGGAGQSKP